MAMDRIVISMPRGLRERVKRLAAQRGISFAEYVREAAEKSANEERPVPQFGIFDSGRADLSDMASDGIQDIPPWH